jgi:type IV secretory pathway VirB10-like protein
VCLWVGGCGTDRGTLYFWLHAYVAAVSTGVFCFAFSVCDCATGRVTLHKGANTDGKTDGKIGNGFTMSHCYNVVELFKCDMTMFLNVYLVTGPDKDKPKQQHQTPIELSLKSSSSSSCAPIAPNAAAAAAHSAPPPPSQSTDSDPLLNCSGCGMYGMRGEFFDSASCSPACSDRVRHKRREREKRERELAAQKQRREAKRKEREVQDAAAAAAAAEDEERKKQKQKIEEEEVSCCFCSLSTIKLMLAFIG